MYEPNLEPAWNQPGTAWNHLEPESGTNLEPAWNRLEPPGTIGSRVWNQPGTSLEPPGTTWNHAKHPIFHMYEPNLEPAWNQPGTAWNRLEPESGTSLEPAWNRLEPPGTT